MGNLPRSFFELDHRLPDNKKVDKLLTEAAQGLDLLVLKVAFAPAAGDRVLTIFVVRKDFN